MAFVTVTPLRIWGLFKQGGHPYLEIVFFEWKNSLITRCYIKHIESSQYYGILVRRVLRGYSVAFYYDKYIEKFSS